VINIDTFTLICTHNPQDFFNGVEPDELIEVCQSTDLERDIKKQLAKGYTVIIIKAREDSG